MFKKAQIQWLSLALVVVIMAGVFITASRRGTRVVLGDTNLGVNGTEASSSTAQSLADASKQITTTVYYQDNEGLLVPVQKKIPEQSGIAKATLNLMIKNPANDMEAAKIGLRTVIPEGTALDIDINKGVATVDLGLSANQLADAAAENNMIAAIVATLTEFSTVDEVQFRLNGSAAEKLTHGTKIDKPLKRGEINIESTTKPTGMFDAETVMLYFPSDDGRLIVPVTRAVYGKADINTAVLELAKGPAKDNALDTVLPDKCGLIDVKLKNGVATVNFSREFISIAEQSDGGRQALKALVLTCTQFEGVKTVKLQVEGEDYDPGKDTLSVPTFVNSADAYTSQFEATNSANIVVID